MVVTNSAATAVAQAGSMWVSRRVRVAQIHQGHQSGGKAHTTAPQIVWSPAFARPKISTFPASWMNPVSTKSSESIESITAMISNKLKEKYAEDEVKLEENLSDLNKDTLWSKYSTLHELSCVESKEDIMKIVRTFLFISKKSIYLFSNFSRKIIADIHNYTCNEIGEIINSFAQLGFLEESFCAQISNRVIDDIHNATPAQLVNIFDGFASTRCYIESVIDTIITTAIPMIPSFTPSHVSLFASSMARLNVKNDQVFALLSRQLLNSSEVYTARDVTLAAYAFAKMKVPVSKDFQARLVILSSHLIRDFTAKELQMLTTALDRWDIIDESIYGSISLQAQRRIAQFSAEALVLLLKALASRSVIDDALITRVVCQLPRLGQNLKTSEITGFLPAFADMKVSSDAGLEVLRPLTVTKAGQFTVSEWLSILKSVSEIGNQKMKQDIVDAFTLINAFPAKYKGTLTPVSSTVVDRLSNGQITELLALVKKIGCVSDELVSVIMANIQDKRLLSHNASDASDLYCVLVSMNYHEDAAMAHIMKGLLCRAIQA